MCEGASMPTTKQSQYFNGAALTNERAHYVKKQLFNGSRSIQGKVYETGRSLECWRSYVYATIEPNAFLQPPTNAHCRTNYERVRTFVYFFNRSVTSLTVNNILCLHLVDSISSRVGAGNIYQKPEKISWMTYSLSTRTTGSLLTLR